MSEPLIPIDAIHVGPRLREDIGDIDHLEALIVAAGRILVPLLVTWAPELGLYRLLDGYRRLLAAWKLGLTHVPVHVMEEGGQGAFRS